MAEKKNNPIDPNLEKILIPQRSGDDIEIKNPKTPSCNKLTEDKKQEAHADTRPEVKRPN